ncbi:hypothetical protein EI77_01358 [Prosthecobacter fusiformis]|uniref:Tetratricopeptide repeat protein n=1 Tax=Prosthecobacter fusiformis TaxID=48464 RepID=A0A4R7S3D0_9BACT|nr:hypothetical protein [Prosthecobacter fusiformis]TDU72892.1 hypothetical protein EI77_01358 [Prosthecobacter fusiformis]
MHAWRPLIGWTVLLGLVPVFACGPFFPENALDKPKGILQPPLFEFSGELYQLKDPWLGEKLAARKPGSPAYTLDLEMAEMETVMQPRLPDEAARKVWLTAYRELRRTMIHHSDRSASSLTTQDREGIAGIETAKPKAEKLMPDMPEDVRLYLEGALLYLSAEDDTAAVVTQAREKWQQVLALPAAQRQWRSTWAAWMLFRTSDPADDAACGQWLAETRKLSLEGFADCLYLGTEATYILGRPASDLPEKSLVSEAAWKRAAFLRAILGMGWGMRDLRHDRWKYGTWSEELAQETLADPFLRQAQLLHLIEVAQNALDWQFGNRTDTPEFPVGDLELWLQSFEKSGLKEQREAGLIAWIYYNAAKFDEAKRWLKLAQSDDVIVLSLKGKLAAMDGRKTEAVKSLEAMAKLLPNDEDEERAMMEDAAQREITPLSADNYLKVRRHHFLADYGRAQLATNDFTGALRTFSKTDFWVDTAYIAERLLSVEELLAMQRAEPMAEAVKTWRVEEESEPKGEVKTIRGLSEKFGGWGRPTDAPVMRHLLGRRLLREQYFKNAHLVLPGELSSASKVYAKACRDGHDRKLPKAQRAEALWQAAQLHRMLGMELVGFETGPDYYAAGGSFELRDMAAFRRQKVWLDEWEHDENTLVAGQQVPTFAATPDEVWRARHYGPKVDKRFHYRYVAAEMAWQAAALMPDDDPKTAEVLCIAGNWLQNRDPKAADRFYKALVRRNPNVPLAQQADKKRWFPEVKWEFDMSLN